MKQPDIGQDRGVILYVGSFEVDPDERAAFVAAAQPHAAASRNDGGCLSFVIAVDSADPRLVHYVERWDSREDLIAHGRATRERALPPNPVAATSSGFELFEPGEPV
jgi:quinol monooxygenase YgiN